MTWSPALAGAFSFQRPDPACASAVEKNKGGHPWSRMASSISRQPSSLMRNVATKVAFQNDVGHGEGIIKAAPKWPPLRSYSELTSSLLCLPGAGE
jgi:hypothetical protein